MMMIICAILIAIGIIATIITGVLIDLKHDPSASLILVFFLSAVLALSAIITFIVGHFAVL